MRRPAVDRLRLPVLVRRHVGRAEERLVGGVARLVLHACHPVRATEQVAEDKGDAALDERLRERQILLLLGCIGTAPHCHTLVTAAPVPRRWRHRSASLAAAAMPGRRGGCGESRLGAAPLRPTVERFSEVGVAVAPEDRIRCRCFGRLNGFGAQPRWLAGFQFEARPDIHRHGCDSAISTRPGTVCVRHGA